MAEKELATSEGLWTLQADEHGDNRFQMLEKRKEKKKSFFISSRIEMSCVRLYETINDIKYEHVLTKYVL